MKNIRDLIARNDLDQALKQLQTMLDNNPLQDEVIQLAARFTDTRRQIRLGMMDHNTASISQNQIRMSLLELLKEVEAQLPPSNAEAQHKEQDVSPSGQHNKNMVSGSTITAGGDVHIGDKHITVIHQAQQMDKPDNPNLP